jgi:hypothetical protein
MSGFVRTVAYVLIGPDGEVVERHRCMRDRVPEAAPEGHKIVVMADGSLPPAEAKFDGRKIRKARTEIATVEEGLSANQRPAVPEDALVRKKQRAALGRVDQEFARRYAEILGPFAAIHAEKLRQAQAGGGPLIADEQERQDVLTKAAEQEELLVAVEKERMAAKAALREATTLGEIAELGAVRLGKAGLKAK